MTVTQVWAYKKLLACVVPLQNISIRGSAKQSYHLTVEMPYLAATYYLHDTRNVAEFIRQYGQ